MKFFLIFCYQIGGTLLGVFLGCLAFFFVWLLGLNFSPDRIFTFGLVGACVMYLINAAQIISDRSDDIQEIMACIFYIFFLVLSSHRIYSLIH